MSKKTIIINLLLLFATTTAWAMTDESGNADTTLAKFNPNQVLAQPQNQSAYIDTQNYPQKITFQPFYIGLSGGFDMTYMEQQIDEDENDQNGNDQNGSDQNDEKSYTGFNGNGTVTIGLGWQEDVFYIGLAADGALSLAEHEYENDMSGIDSVKIPYAIGAYLVPGAFINHHTLFYMKLGGVYSRLETSSFSKNIWGGRGGLGLRYFFTPHFSINGEYVFTYYESVTEQQFKYSPLLTNQINVGFAIHF